MQSPFDRDNKPGVYFNPKRRIFQRIQSAKVEEQIKEVVTKIYEDAITAENVMLSHSERRRLFSQVLELILEDMVGKSDNDSHPG
jgi:hypothetical protein